MVLICWQRTVGEGPCSATEGEERARENRAQSSGQKRPMAGEGGPGSWLDVGSTSCARPGHRGSGQKRPMAGGSSFRERLKKIKGRGRGRGGAREGGRAAGSAARSTPVPPSQRESQPWGQSSGDRPAERGGRGWWGMGRSAMSNGPKRTQCSVTSQSPASCDPN